MEMATMKKQRTKESRNLYKIEFRQGAFWVVAESIPLAVTSVLDLLPSISASDVLMVKQLCVGGHLLVISD